MADPPEEIRTWPTTPDVLTDVHTCPGCFAPVAAPSCPVCGFVFTDPRAKEVLALGRGIASYEVRRQRLIDEIRSTYRTPVPAPTSVATPPAPVEVAATVGASSPRQVVEPTLPEPSTQPAAIAPKPPREPRPPRRRLSVPVLLLIVGVSLVGIAAVFFLVYAWFTWGIAVRALIIGAITVATIAIASLLRRRSLTTTAEGIAVLGVLLLGLDAWAVRANDFFGTAQMSGALYAGIGALAVGVLCRGWAKLSGLRSPDIGAVLALPVGLGLLLAGLTSPPLAEAIVVGLLGASAGGLVHALPPPWSAARAHADAVPERVTLAVIGVTALVTATLVATYASLDDPWLTLWSGAGIVVLGAAHTWVALRRRGEEPPLPASALLAGVASSTASAVAAALGWQIAVRADAPVFTLLVGPVTAVAVAVLVDRMHVRVSGLRAARITAAVVAALSLVTAVVVWGAEAAQAIVGGWTAWRTDPFAAAVGQTDGAIFAAIAGVLIAALLFVAPTLSLPLLRNVRMPVASVVLLVGVAVLAVPGLLVGAAALIALAATLALRRAVVRPGAAAAAGVGAVTAFLAGIPTPWLWLIGVGIAIGVPIAAQVIVRPSARTAVALTLAPIGVAGIAALLAPSALGAVLDAPANPAVTAVLLQWIALVAVLCAVVLPGGPASRSTLAVSGYALFVFSLLPSGRDIVAAVDGIPVPTAQVPTELGEPFLAIVRSAALLALLAVIAFGRTRVASGAALAAAALVAPLAAATTSAVLRTAGLEQHGAHAVALVGAAVAVSCIAAVWSMLPSRGLSAAQQSATAPPASAEPVSATSSPISPNTQRPDTRALIDVGALATTLVFAWGVGEEFRWVMLAVIALGIAAAAVSRGWAAPASEGTAALPSTRAVGVPTERAPRRLLAWPALVIATSALWVALYTSPGAVSLPVEPYVLPPAVALLAFAVLLVWLRRQGEAAVALTASLLLGLAIPAVAGWTVSPVRSTVVAIVSAAVCLLLTWTPALRARVPALAGAATAVLALALVCTQRAMSDAPATSWWLLLLIAASYACALGATRPLTDGKRRSSFAAIVPTLALVAAFGAGIPSADLVPVLAGALVLLASLHIGSAALDRDPFGPAARWTALAAAAAFAAAGFFGGAATVDGTPVIELVSLPVALTVLAGSAAAYWQRYRTGQARSKAEPRVWLAGVVLAVVPSIAAPVEALRVWLVIVLTLTAALVAVLAPLRRAHVLRTSSAALLAAASVAMAVRALAAPDADFAEPAAIVAGAGALLIAAAMIWTSASPPNPLATTIAVGGAALLVATVIVFGDGAIARTVVTAMVAGTIAVGGAALLGVARWRGLSATLAVAGLIAALVALASRYIVTAPTAAGSIEPDLWAVLALAITAAVGVMALRATADTPVAVSTATAVGVAFAAAVVLFAIAELLLLGYGTGEQLRTVLTMSALSLAVFGGVVVRARLGLTPPLTAAVAAAGFGAVALFVYGVSPVELVTVPPALGAVALGVRTLTRNPQSRTWPSLGPGLALLTLPSLAYDFFGEAELWRIVALGVAALALVVIGAVGRLQAPLIVGSAVLLLHGAAQLWPWISAAYVNVPWWLWLGIGGALLIFIAARYEKNMRAVRTAFTAVTSLR